MSEQLPPPAPGSMISPPAGAPAPRRGAQRWLRVLAPVGIVAVALGGFAVAQAAIDDSGNDSPRDLIENTTPSTLPDGTPVDDHGGLTGATRGGSVGGGGDVTQNVTFINDAIADGSTQTFGAGAAGTVTISRSGATLTVVSSAANPGWTAFVEAASGPEVEVKFTAAGARIDLEAEIEDGGVRVRVRERTAVTAPGTTDPTAPRVDNSGPGSIDDDSGSDDHSGSGSGSDDSPDVDDDHSGSGSGSDDSPDVDDDHSGSGSGSDDSPDVDDDHDDDSGSGSGSGSGGSGSGSGSGGSGSGSGSGGSDDD